MMDWLNPSKPAYRCRQAAPQQSRTGMLSGIWCYLFGDYAVCYSRRGVEGGYAAPAAQRRGWFASLKGPPYKTAHKTMIVDALTEDSSDMECASECADSTVEVCNEIRID